MNRSEDFYGLPTVSIGNDRLRIDVLAEAGPRIVRLVLAGSTDNQLAEVPSQTWETPYGTYSIRGGHRLWHAPEAFPRSYIPDDEGLTIEPTASGLRLIQPTETATGIAKQIEITLHDTSAGPVTLTLDHRLQNNGLWPVELAPWALTQLPFGGVAVLPQPVVVDSAALLPDRHLTLWPYTRWSDQRLAPHDDYVLLYARPEMPPCKVGYLNDHGWVGYLRDGVFFCKRFTPHPDRQHPDRNCNVESFCGDLFIELETIAPLTMLEPGQTATHRETWEWYSGVEADGSIESVRALVATLNLQPHGEQRP